MKRKSKKKSVQASEREDVNRDRKSQRSDPSHESHPDPGLLELQRQIGNKAVNGLVQRVEASETEDELMDVSNLGKKGRLKGHPKQDGAAPVKIERTGVETPEIQKRGPFGVEATVNLTLESPVFDNSKTTEQIRAEHPEDPNVVAWAEPEFSVAPTRLTSKSTDIDATVQEKIDLPSEYTGTRGQIVRDHELGHDNIAKKVAQAELKEKLESNLESKLSLNPAITQAAITSAVGAFETEEANLSIVYDAVDYPRMELAFYAARTALTVLEGDSASITNVAASLRNFNNTIRSASPGQSVSLAQDLTTACEALNQDELNMLQYNPEFKQLVETAKSQIDAYIQDQLFYVFSSPISKLSEATRATLSDLKTKLDGFTWHAPEGDAI